MPPAGQAKVDALSTALRQRHLAASELWLATFLAEQNRTTTSSTSSTAALLATATSQLLASDITQTLTANSSSGNEADTFAPSLASPRIPTTTLRCDVTCQVLDIHDVGRSVHAQLEECEMFARGEAYASSSSSATSGSGPGGGRGSVVRLVPESEGGGHDGLDGDGDGNGQSSHHSNAGGRKIGPLKFLLQDVRGGLIWAFDGAAVLKVGPGYLVGDGGSAGGSAGVAGGGSIVGIGTKLVLRRGASVARGMLLLEHGSVLVLGGNIDVLERAWRDGRLGRLKGLLDGGLGGEES